MIKTICIDKEVPVGRNRAEFMAEQIGNVISIMAGFCHSWITSLSTDGRFITITAQYSENYPGESKPSVICSEVIALNDSNKDYKELHNQKYSEEKIRNILFGEVEKETEKYGKIKSWNMVYVHEYAIIIVSV